MSAYFGHNYSKTWSIYPTTKMKINNIQGWSKNVKSSKHLKDQVVTTTTK